MSIISFDHYNLRAPRPLLDELCKFYCDVVGLHVGTRPPFNSFGYWLYADAQDVLHLSEASADEVRHINVSGTFDHVAFNCTELHNVEHRLQQQGIRYRQSIVPLTDRIQLFFNDPAGNGVELNFEGKENS